MMEYPVFKAKILTKSSIKIANASLFEILYTGSNPTAGGPIWITWAGQSSAAFLTHSSSSSKTTPSFSFPAILNLAATWLHPSSAFSAKKSGQISQHWPQLMQPSRSIITLIMNHHSFNAIGLFGPSPQFDLIFGRSYIEILLLLYRRPCPKARWIEKKSAMRSKPSASCTRR